MHTINYFLRSFYYQPSGSLSDIRKSGIDVLIDDERIFTAIDLDSAEFAARDFLGMG